MQVQFTKSEGLRQMLKEGQSALCITAASGFQKAAYTFLVPLHSPTALFDWLGSGSEQGNGKDSFRCVSHSNLLPGKSN